MWRRQGVCCSLLLTLLACDAARGQGLLLPGAGPVNRSMAGASTAAPLDAAGAGYWNPAAVSGLGRNEVMFGAELLYADTKVASAIGGGALSGETFSDTGLSTLPTIALVYTPEDSIATLALGVYALSGGSANFPTDATNPLLSPFVMGSPSGFGGEYSSAAVLQIAPILSVQVTERLSIGLGPQIDYMTLQLDPAFFAGANADGSFPSAINGRPFWGGGFQVGAYWEPNPDWAFGLAYKSEQWFETLEYNSADENGNFLPLELEFTLPQIVSMGLAYHGWQRTVVAADVRYFDYAGTKTLGDSPAAGGVGWQSIFSAAVGVQRQVGDSCAVRMGYSFNENPIPSALTLFNVELPAVTQHQLTLGFSKQVAKHLRLDLGMVYAFQNSINGPVAQVPNSAVRIKQSIVSLSAGTAVTF